LTQTSEKLRHLFDPSRVDAIGANQRAFDLPVEVRAHALQVWPPGPFGFVVGVTDIVSD
jgi:hypothetical protein